MAVAIDLTGKVALVTGASISDEPWMFGDADCESTIAF